MLYPFGGGCRAKEYPVILGLKTREIDMPLVRDQELEIMGIEPRAHVVRRYGQSRVRWPFKAMVVNDFFTLDLETLDKAKNALKSFNRRYPHRRFSVRPQQGNVDVYVVRRVS
jgi:hypothetical protein